MYASYVLLHPMPPHLDNMQTTGKDRHESNVAYIVPLLVIDEYGSVTIMSVCKYHIRTFMHNRNPTKFSTTHAIKSNYQVSYM